MVAAFAELFTQMWIGELGGAPLEEGRRIKFSTLAVPSPKEKAPAPLSRVIPFRAIFAEDTTRELMFTEPVWLPVRYKLIPGVPLFKGPEVLWVKSKFPEGVPFHSPMSPALEVGTVPPQLAAASMSIPSPPPVQIRVAPWPRATVEDTAQANPIRSFSILVTLFIRFWGVWGRCLVLRFKTRTQVFDRSTVAWP
jgi:hypothetical protein